MSQEYIRDSSEYKAIADFYGDRTAKRSGVRLMDHIHDGLVVMHCIGASFEAMQAYCLHPLFQDDDCLANSLDELGLHGFSPYALVLTMEYRAWANVWLSDKVRRPVWLGSDGKVKATGELEAEGRPYAGPLQSVAHMLIADKVQNYKDFQTYHKGKHPRSDELELYFTHWLRQLNVSAGQYSELSTAIDKMKAINATPR